MFVRWYLPAHLPPPADLPTYPPPPACACARCRSFAPLKRTLGTKRCVRAWVRAWVRARVRLRLRVRAYACVRLFGVYVRAPVCVCVLECWRV